MTTTEFMLTTVDNPYNPFTEFDQWYAYDVQVGHHTLALQARVTRTSDELSDLDQSLAIDYGMETVLEEDHTGNYRKVFHPDSPQVNATTLV